MMWDSLFALARLNEAGTQPVKRAVIVSGDRDIMVLAKFDISATKRAALLK